MADSFKLRMKVGVHEFDAEGPKDEVNARFEAWQVMIQAVNPKVQGSGTVTIVEPLYTGSPATTEEQPKVQNPFAIRVFAVDDRRDLVTLRVHPTGENVDADAILAIVYGFRELRGLDEVPVTKLTQSVRVSGLRANRIDRAAAPHVRGQFLIKNGSGKGGRYLLTNTGRARAEALVKELYDRVA